MTTELQRLVIDEFSGKNTQAQYAQLALTGWWDAEKQILGKYFTKKRARVLDLGCGTGRTSLPLHDVGYDVVGVDITPAMVTSAQQIAASFAVKIDYRVGDATALELADNTFDYVLFSNQGWTQIPGHANRLRALAEVRRVLVPGGVFVFTTHQRVWTKEHRAFWRKQWLSYYVLKPLGLRIEELDFGDRFFQRAWEQPAAQRSGQYVHIPSVAAVIRAIRKSGFTILEVTTRLQRDEKNPIAHPPAFYVCQK